MKFKSKLYASIGFILVLISISVIILMKMLEQSMVNINLVVTELYERIDIANELKYETGNVGRVFQEIISNGSNDEMRLKNSWEETNLKISQAIQSLGNMETEEQSFSLLQKYEALHNSYQDIAQQVITSQKMNGSSEVSNEILEEVRITRERMEQIANLLIGLQEQQMNNELLRSRDTYNWAIRVIYVYLAVALVVGLGLISLLIRNLTKNLNHVTSVMKSVNNHNAGNLPRIDINSKDEIGSIATAFNKMVTELEAFSTHEKKLLQEAEEHSWIKTKIAELATMYAGAKDIAMLGGLLISKLVPTVGAGFGVFYYKEKEGEQHYLKRLATYACCDTYLKNERFQIGEGLIGQCVLEKKRILLERVPENYIKIQSGTGEGTPKNIIILPIEFEGNVLAVIEIGSFEPFSTTQIELLEEVTNTVGITINSISNHMIAEKLLQESQALTEELQVQSEELQTQQEELRLTNEKLEEQYEASEQKKRELEEVKVALEEKAQQLEVSSQYKSEFLANMSHELRTPLNSLLILAKIVSENSEGNLTEKQLEYIRTIHTSGNDLLRLINDVLDLAKVESGKLDVIRKEIALQTIKEQLFNVFAPIAHQKELQFDIHIERDVPHHFYTDEHRLKQVLKNLLSNAFKFTEFGSVSLVIQKVANKEIDERDTYMLAFSVIDTGIGIPFEKQGTIFEAFKQADGTTSRKYGGTGLGLSISREIAHLLSGYIELESKEGAGSKFTLYLPLREYNKPILVDSYKETASSVLKDEDYTQKHAGDSLKEAGKSALRNKKVLIVDDDIRNVYALTIVLEKCEMDIIVAENGREGIEMLKGNPDTDIILMDIMMPEMDGLEAIKRIRKIPKFEALPIIALTAKAKKKNRDECIESGATDYISKPIDVDQLLSLMHVWLYGKDVRRLGNE